MSLDWARYGWLYFSLILVIKNRYGFTNISDVQDLKRAYPLLDMVDRETRYNYANVCSVLTQFCNCLSKCFIYWVIELLLEQFLFECENVILVLNYM